eukprot:6334883-Amphidinium_carterae.1
MQCDPTFPQSHALCANCKGTPPEKAQPAFKPHAQVTSLSQDFLQLQGTSPEEFAPIDCGSAEQHTPLFTHPFFPRRRRTSGPSSRGKT